MKTRLALTGIVLIVLGVSSVFPMQQSRATSSFTDVRDSAVYAEAVESLSAAGILTGFSDGTFRPTARLTRSVLITSAVRAREVDLTGYTETGCFDDLGSLTETDALSVCYAVQAGWIPQYAGTLLGPGTAVTYGDVTTTLSAVFSTLPSDYLARETALKSSLIKRGTYAKVLYDTLALNTGAWLAPYNYAEVLQKAMLFYEAQYSGTLLANHRVAWRADAHVNDGSDQGLDLSGGYHDAGDNIKYGLPMAQMTTLLAWSGIAFEDGYRESGQMQYLRNNVQWATDYFIKAHAGDHVFYFQVGNTENDHKLWAPPEVWDESLDRPSYALDAVSGGDDILGQTAAALAAAAILFDDDPAYAATLLDHARQLYDWALEDPDGDGAFELYTPIDNYVSTSAADDVSMAALWLYQATGESAYLDDAKTWADTFGYFNQRGYSWNQSENAVRMLLAVLTGEASHVESTEAYLDWWSTGDADGDRVYYTPGGLAWLDEGALRHSANVAFNAVIYANSLPDSDPKKETYMQFALDQIHYMLGDNPRGSSYVVGFGVNPPDTIVHHRGAHNSPKNDSDYPEKNPHILYGCLIGGPDELDLFDQYTRHDHEHTECEVDGTAALPALMAWLVEEHGTSPLAPFPDPEIREPEFFIRDFSVTTADHKFTVSYELANETKYPVRPADGMTVRSFYDLTEFFAAGYSPSDVTDEIEVISYYCNGCTVSSLLQPWSGNLYYVDMEWGSTLFVPNGESQYKRQGKVQLSAYGAPVEALDVTNDPVYTSLDSLVIYEDGVVVAGIEPNR